MSLIVVKSGIMDTIQDAGRPGNAHLGVPVAGAADRAAFSVGNLLVGNQTDTAAIEIHWPAPVFLLDSPAFIALCGADFGATANGIPLKPNAAKYLSGQTEIRFGSRVSGARAYLCVRGGFQVPRVAGSCSTHLLSGTGGYDGRKLQSGDRIQFDITLQEPLVELQARIAGLYPPDNTIRFIPGPEYTSLHDHDMQALERENWQIGLRSDRMGCELSGPLLALKKTGEMVSSAVVPGTIQLPPGGKPFVLLNDCQTTGGYPRIGQIVEADLSAVARLYPGETFRLVKVNREEALLAGYLHRLYLRRLAQGCRWHMK